MCSHYNHPIFLETQFLWKIFQLRKTFGSIHLRLRYQMCPLLISNDRGMICEIFGSISNLLIDYRDTISLTWICGQSLWKELVMVRQHFKGLLQPKKELSSQNSRWLWVLFLKDELCPWLPNPSLIYQLSSLLIESIWKDK